MNILIFDEGLDGKKKHQSEIQIEAETITAKELIAHRVSSEVQKFRESGSRKFQGFVEPVWLKKMLDANRLEANEVDVEKQIYVALSAFQKNGFFIIVDDKQIESLEQEIILHKDMKVSFIKLISLIGG